jgi:3-hydroxyisobutyrate dehydrogenase/glyoxylate/succinic semialdehyde reductase
MKMKVGFIGLGIMGSRMAANLQEQGYDLVVFNRTRAKAQPLLDKGATFAESPAKLAEEVDILFTMLAHPDAVAQAALRANGFLNHLKPKSLWVDCSSVNPSFSKKMATAAAARRVRFLDAPVTGSAPVAKEAKLVFWVGGYAGDLEAVRPLLLSMGSKIVYAGGQGMGTSMKMVINLLLGVGMASFAEAMALGQGLGLSQKMLFDSLLGLPAVAPFLTSKRAKIEKGDYAPEFPLRWMQKDLFLASVSAHEAGVAMPVTNLTKEIYRFAMRDGHDTEDFSAIYQFVAGDNGKAPNSTAHEGGSLETTRREVAMMASTDTTTNHGRKARRPKSYANGSAPEASF